MYIDDNTMEWLLFGVLVLLIFCPLFVIVNRIIFKGERVAAGIFSAGLSVLVAGSFLRNRELLDFIHERLAFICVGLVIATFSIMKLRK